MNMRRKILVFLALLALLPSLVLAQSVGVGDVTVHYSAIPTTTLTPEVAQQYGITRSSNRVLVNIAVRRGKPGEDVAVPSTVAVSATNLNGQRQTVELREVKEGDAIYYLGQARINGNETLRFDIEVKIPGRGEPIRANFRQEFYVQ